MITEPNEITEALIISLNKASSNKLDFGVIRHSFKGEYNIDDLMFESQISLLSQYKVAHTLHQNGLKYIEKLENFGIVVRAGGLARYIEKQKEQEYINQQLIKSTLETNKSVIKTNKSIIETNESVKITNDSVRTTNQTAVKTNESIQTLNDTMIKLAAFQRRTTLLTLIIAALAFFTSVQQCRDNRSQQQDKYNKPQIEYKPDSVKTN